MVERDGQEGDEPADGEAGSPRFARDRKLWAVMGLLVLVSLVVSIVAFGSDGRGGGLDGLETVEGVPVEVSGERILLRLHEPSEEGEKLELVVRPEDRARLDVWHLENEHVPWQLPIRVHYERDGDERVARRAIDLPVEAFGR